MKAVGYWAQPLQIDTLRTLLDAPSLEVWIEPIGAEAQDGSRVGERPSQGNSQVSSQVNRLRIRKFLAERWASELSGCDIENLEVRPRGVSKFFSISHCPGFLGVMASDRCCGLDLEIATRVKESSARRVSVDGEMAISPSPAHLWTAKESFFKSVLEAEQPPTISEIHISNWKQAEAGLWTYSAETLTRSASGQGVVVQTPSLRNLIFAISLI